MLTITDAAANVLKPMLEENHADGLMATLHQTCCSAAPVFQMVRYEEGDKPVEINGIKVLMDEDTAKYCDDAFVDLQNGELMVFAPAEGGGCGCGGHHDHEGGCCHGDDHDHEGGCCYGDDHDHEGGCCHGDDHDHEGGCCHGEGHDGDCCNSHE